MNSPALSPATRRTDSMVPRLLVSISEQTLMVNARFLG